MEFASDYSLLNQGSYTEGVEAAASLPFVAGPVRRWRRRPLGRELRNVHGAPNASKVPRPQRGRSCSKISSQGVLKADLKRFIPGYVDHYTAASDYLFDLLRPLMQDLLPHAYRYADCFDRFEYLMAPRSVISRNIVRV
jgi:hypothetical protein